MQHKGCYYNISAKQWKACAPVCRGTFGASQLKEHLCFDGCRGKCKKQMVTDLQFLATGLHESESTKITLLVNQDEVKAPDLAKQVSAMAKNHPPTSKFNLWKLLHTKQVTITDLYPIKVFRLHVGYLRLSIHYRHDLLATLHHRFWR